MSTKWRYGWRFLNAAGGTNPGTPREFYSTLPRQDETWSDWTEHPDAATPDGQDCGPNRLHVMLKPDARYAPSNWWPWYARWRAEDETGRSQEKASVARYQLRRLRPTAWHRIIRLGWCREANLSWASLGGANLSWANLYGADLSGADLSWANLYGADLSGASLGGADLSKASLSEADLRWANLYGANLYGADLSKASLGGANLYGANLSGAKYDNKTIWPEGFIPNEEMIRA